MLRNRLIFFLSIISAFSGYLRAQDRKALESCIAHMMMDRTLSLWADLFACATVAPPLDNLSIEELEVLCSLPSPAVSRQFDYPDSAPEIARQLRQITGPVVSLFSTSQASSLPYGARRQRILFERGENVYLSVNYFSYPENRGGTADSLILRILPSLEVVRATDAFKGHRFKIYEAQATRPAFDGVTNADGWIRFPAPQRERLYRVEYVGWNTD